MVVSQLTDIRRALEQGEVLTPLMALERFGTMRLAARVQELRMAGLPIVTGEHVTANGKRVGAYWLPVGQELV